jgi:hypothetical protein
MVKVTVAMCLIAMLTEKNSLVSAFSVHVNSLQLRPRLSNNIRSMSMMVSTENSLSPQIAVKKEKNQFLTGFIQKTPIVLKKVGKFLVPLTLQMGVMVLFSFVSPALAKKGREVASKKGGAAAVG